MNGADVHYTGSDYFTSLSVTGGFIYRVSETLALRAGIGYGARILLYETFSHQYVKNTDDSAKGVDLSVGAQSSLGKILVSLDAVTTNFKVFEAKLGVGYNFYK